MKRFAVLLCLLGFARLGLAADAPSDAGLAEVSELGRLNGVALACGYIDNAARIKTAIITFAPKSRRYGAAFEEATNAAYLKQARQDQTSCIDGPTLSGLVDEFAQRLMTAVPPAPAK